MSARVTAAVALGANLGDPARTFQRALTRLENAPGVTVLRRSRWYRTDPVGGPEGQPEFLNGALLLETDRGPRELLELLLSVERELGRERAGAAHHGPRTIDLDLLWHGDATCAEEGLTLPHPGLEERLFVLVPLADLVPERVLPGCGRSVRERVLELGERGTESAPRPVEAGA